MLNAEVVNDCCSGGGDADERFGNADPLGEMNVGNAGLPLFSLRVPVWLLSRSCSVVMVVGTGTGLKGTAGLE